MDVLGSEAGMARAGKPEQLARALAAEVRTLPEGAALPSENALAGRFGVSRVVVREAVARLRADGLVRTERGRGHFVAAPVSVSALDNGPGPAAAAGPPAGASGEADEFAGPPADLKALLQLIELRAALESQAAALAARRRSAEDLALMEAAIERMRVAIETGEVLAGVAADFEFHRAILTATGNAYFRHFADVVARPLSDALRVARERSASRPAQRWQAQQEHQQIYDAIRLGNPRTARAAAQLHINNTAKRLASAFPTAD